MTFSWHFHEYVCCRDCACVDEFKDIGSNAVSMRVPSKSVCAVVEFEDAAKRATFVELLQQHFKEGASKYDGEYPVCWNDDNAAERSNDKDEKMFNVLYEKAAKKASKKKASAAATTGTFIHD